MPVLAEALLLVVLAVGFVAFPSLRLVPSEQVPVEFLSAAVDAVAAVGSWHAVLALAPVPFSTEPDVPVEQVLPVRLDVPVSLAEQAFPLVAVAAVFRVPLDPVVSLVVLAGRKPLPTVPTTKTMQMY